MRNEDVFCARTSTCHPSGVQCRTPVAFWPTRSLYSMSSMVVDPTLSKDSKQKLNNSADTENKDIASSHAMSNMTT